MFLRDFLRRPRLSSFLLLLLVGLVGCGGGDSDDAAAANDREWVSETTTEGDVTTVRTISGSVWGGSADMVEEMSIGVEAGEDPYMLGSVRGIAVHDGEIFVLDQQIPAIRVYDLEGRHLRDLGAEGSGPGEFQRPESLVVDGEGRLYIRDPRNGRIMIMSAEGEELGVIRITSTFSTSNSMVITDDGTLYNYELLNQGSDVTDWQLGMVPKYEDEEMEGEPVAAPFADFEPATIVARREGSTSSNGVPFAANRHWTLAPSGAIVGGISDDYSFEVRYPDGSVTRVEKSWQPVPVDAAEADWQRKSATANMRNTQPDWTWNGPEIPDAKPAFSQFVADHSGRIWVQRPGPGYHVDEECNEDPGPDEPYGTPCWRSESSWEVFDVEGRYLGGVDMPENLNLFVPPHIENDMMVAAATDDFGTVMVKRFRIVLPAE